MELIAYTFGYLLKFWFWLCGNYGLAMILFSITIKLILFPMTLKQQKSLKKNQELQPKLNELQQKYANNQEQMAIEYQKFMKENKFNPFGGCLLSIVQIFVLFGVLYVVINPMKYMEKYDKAQLDEALQQSLVNNEYSGDMALYTRAVTNFYYKDPSGDKQLVSGDVFVKANEEFLVNYTKTNRYYELRLLEEKYNNGELVLLGIDLSEITAQNPSKIRLWIFPILTTLFYYISLWMVSKKQKGTQKIKDANGEEIEMPNMMMMNIFMPVMSGFISYSVPQSMGLYWFINSFIQIIIQLVSDKIINKNKDEKSNSSSKQVILKPVEAIKEDESKEESQEKNQDDTKDSPIKDNSKKKKNKKNKKK